MGLEQRVKDALDEADARARRPVAARILFQRGAATVLRSAIATGQLVHVTGLGLLLAAFALAVAPATWHRMAEHGNDKPCHCHS